MGLLRRSLEPAGYELDFARGGANAVSKALSDDYQIIILEADAAGPDAIKVCRRLRESSCWVPVLVLGGHRASEDVVRGLDAGADDYLVKPFAVPELEARMRALMRREAQARPTILRVGDLELDPATRAVTLDGSSVALTPREFALLHLFMRHPGAVLSRMTILDAIWSYTYEATSNVVDVCVRSLRQKIERPFGRSFIHSIRGIGYKLVPDTHDQAGWKGKRAASARQDARELASAN